MGAVGLLPALFFPARKPLNRLSLRGFERSAMFGSVAVACPSASIVEHLARRKAKGNGEIVAGAPAVFISASQTIWPALRPTAFKVPGA